ncbi:MAG: bifunctional riboflavin kinase/FAD synthetase [Pseudomonadota bacterium]
MVSADGAPIVAAIGNFDGVHLGHRRLIVETARLAADVGAAPGAVVFDPHPRRFFQPDAAPFRISAADDRDALLMQAGAARVIRLPFDADLAAMTPREFVIDVLKARLGLAGVATGSEFRFGKGRVGTSEDLKEICEEAGLAYRAIDPLSDEAGRGGGKVGSSGVREAIRAGDMASAASMLGRLWSVSGVVEEGRRLGRTIGFPTANLRLGDIVEPRKGVYAVRVASAGGVSDGVANFGRRPTVGSDAPLLEAHLFDFDGDLYGAEIEVRFAAFLRDEVKFDGVDALKAQIAIDAEDARRALTRLS